MPYPVHPMDPNDPNYDVKLDPHNSQYDPNDPRLVGGVSPYVVPPKKPDPKDYSDLFGEEDNIKQIKQTQTAGPAVASGKPRVKDYADLFEEPEKPQPASFQDRFTGAAPSQPDESGFFGALPRQVREHPYAAGALAAVLAAPTLALVPEIGIPLATGLMGLLRNRAIQTGTGIALGQQLGPRASEGLHYLLRLSGVEGEQSP